MRIFSYLLIAGLIFTPFSFAAQDREFDRIITDDALLFINNDSPHSPKPEFPNFDASMQKLVETFGDFLEWQLLKREWDAIGDALALPDGLSPLKGDRWAFAVFGLGETVSQIPSILYIAEVNDPAAAGQLLNGLFEKATELHLPLKREEDQYLDFTIQSLYGPGMIPGLSLAYSLHDHLLFLCSSKPQLIHILENLDLEEGKIEDNPDYQTVLSQLPKPRHCTLFCNLSSIPDIANGILSSLKALQLLNEDEDLEKALDIADMIVPKLSKIVKAIGAAYQNTNDGHYITTTYIHLHPEANESLIAPLFGKKPASFSFDQYLPRKTGSFYAANIFSLNDIWNVVKHFITDLPEDQNPLNQLNEVEEQIGLSLENDILSWMGDEWCVARMVMDLNSVIPTNRVVFMMKVADQNKAEAALAKIQSVLIEKHQAPITAETEDYRYSKITTYRLPIPILPVSPSWCIKDGMLLLTSDASLLREMLDVKAGSTGGIERNRYFRELKDAAAKPSNFLSFQDTESEFYTYREALRRVSSISELGKEFGGEETMIPFMLMDRGAYLLTCLQVLKGNVQTISIDEKAIVSRKETIQRDLRSTPSVDTMLRYKLSLGAKGEIVKLGDWLVEKGDADRAIRIYAILSEFYPSDLKYLSRLSDICLQEGKRDKAVNAYEQALETAPSTELLIELENVRQSTDAEEIIARVKREAEQTARIDETEALLGIALARYEAGDEDIAKAVLTSLIQRFPDSTAAEKANEALEKEKETN